jgi:hypothetical protein
MPTIMLKTVGNQKVEVSSFATNDINLEDAV